MSHFCINSRIVFFTTVNSPAYYSDNIPDVSVTCYNQRSPRITLEKKKNTVNVINVRMTVSQQFNI